MATTAETLEALDKSLEKWRKLSRGEGEDMGIKNCALCRLFWDESCFGCPVYEYSGFPECEGTPYMDGWFHRYNDTFPLTVRNEGDRSAARKEYRFLLKVRDRYRETTES